jgi:predicted acyltransferase
LKNPYKTLNAAHLPLFSIITNNSAASKPNLAGKRSRSCSSSSSITDKVFPAFLFVLIFGFSFPFPAISPQHHENLHITYLMKKLDN